MRGALFGLQHACLGYGQHPVLKGVDFAVESGSFVGVLGYNGSGKTTMLKTVLGLLPCLKGRVLHRGPARFGYVPQKEKLDPLYPLTAYDVAALGTCRGLELFSGLRAASRRPAVETCLAECGALEFSARRYSDLSGGQRQRVLIARALAAGPEILALDEPLSGIDISTQAALIALLKALKEKRGLTVLMVSHRVQAEKELFTHIVWCEDGKAVMGPAREMLSGGRIGQVFQSEL
ncbi:MAG: ATP-binding cassette domain-containing protein [Elusimicrobia bacterium]|nr:ATP-binding cassette domain-containing protein [Elusimicrobiota bacterium]